MITDFAHLHVHTEYSLLDGFSRTRKLAQQAKARGMSHLAITDHGAMYGAIEFYKACKAEGINPVIGIEAYLTEDMDDHSKRFSDDYHHLLLLAKNNIGYYNLLKLTTIANTQGWHLRPRIDKKVLARYAEGLIVTSTCLSGEIPKLLLKERTEEANKVANWYRDVFGPENFYLEIQEHHGIFDDGKPSPQTQLNQLLYRMHKELNIPMVATNDLHYVDDNDHASHDVLLCVQTGKQLNTPKRMRFDSHEYYLKSPEEMAQLFPELPDALANSVRIAEQCCVDPLSYKARLPNYTIPSEYATQKDYLYALCVEGVKERFGGMNDTIFRQLAYEINMIDQKGFVPYFLIEWDFVNYARSNGIRCSARGSAAGSLMAYTLGITNVDPIRYQLPFERFFNTERADMPDIDMDFPDDRREEVIDYVARKYGNDCVAQMVTFNTMAAKASVKDVARVMGQQNVGDRITRLIPTGPKVTLQGSLDSVRELNTLYNESRPAREIIDQALKLEGSVRATGVHAAGVIVANESLEHFVPLQLRDPKDSSKGRITQYEQMHLEELGLIKFDFLGLSNLTILDNALKNIKKARNEDVVLEKIPLDPTGDDEQDRKREKAFELLAKAETTGIFQLEGSKMREYIKQLKPTRVEDVMAMIALYRPGPMDSIPDFIAAKHGKKRVTYLDPRLAEWLEESYGIIVYQDQVLFIAVNMAGFSWGKVNKFRKALSKKIMHEVEGYKGDFIQGCVNNGMKQDSAEQLFTLILPFGGYGFNKAHAASYAVVAFYTAYLKANYAPEFLAAMLTTESQGAKATKKVPLAVSECKRRGVRILRPDINRSQAAFSVEEGAVRFGLDGIRGVGSKLVKEIIRARSAGGSFTSLVNVYERLSQELSKGVLETLIKVGALDEFGDRNQMLISVDDAIRWVENEQAAKQRGLLLLFEASESAFSFALKSEVKPVTNEQMLTWEKEHLLAYISGHPLDRYEVALAAKCSHTTMTVSEESNKQKVTLGGMIIEVRRFTTRAGKMMLVAKLEDLVGSVEVLVFQDVFDQSTSLWKEGMVVTIHGEVKADAKRDQENDEVSIICRRVESLQYHEGENVEHYRVSFTLTVSGNDPRSRSNDIIRIHKFFQLLRDHPGPDCFDLFVDDVPIDVDGQHSYAHVSLSIEEGLNTIGYTPSFHREAVALLGPDAVRVQVMRKREPTVA